MKILGKKPVCITFTAPINQQTASTIIGTISQAVSQAHHDDIHLVFATPGGSVADGISVYNFMRSLQVPITTYNLGTIDSIGNVVFMGGVHRVSLPVSRFMFHGVGFDIEKARFELKELRERIGNIENDQSMIADILVEHTNLTIEQVENLFLEAAFLRADEACERGIVHDVRQIKLPKDVPVLSLVLQR